MRAWILFLCCCFSTLPTISQVVVKGIVLDENQQPIENTSVFMNNTSYSTLTAADGTYELQVPAGNYELIAYQYGYSSITETMGVHHPLEVNINLKPLSVDLVSQEVTADRDPQWYKHLEEFKRGFLGVSRNGKACDLLNPTTMILDGDLENDYLKGWARQPLLIRNKHLGYDISYVLETYEREGGLSSYAGYVSYTDIPDFPLKKKHHKARASAYRGSTMHFIRSLIAGTAEQEGFQIQKLVSKDWKWVPVPATFDEILSVEDDGFYLKGSGRYELTYNKEKPEIAHTKVSNPTGAKITPYGQISELEFLQRKVKLLPSGAMDPPFGVIFRGYMGWEKVGDALPLDYQPNP